MAEVGTAFLSIVPSARGFGASLSSQMGPQMDSAGKAAGTRMSAGMKAGLLAGAVVAGAAVGKFLASSIAEAQESAKISNVTEQLIKNQGAAATVSATQVGKLSLALSQKTGVDDEAIQSGQNLLLSFQTIQNQAGKGNAIFNRASTAIVDLGTKMGSPEAAAKVLGKALNDPLKGMTALTRAGVPLSKSQQEQVKAFMAAGDTLSAQKVILDAVEQKMGGVAAAQATGAEKMSNAWGNFKEAIGAKLLPVIEAVTAALTPLIEKIASSPAALTAFAIVLGTVLVVAFAAALVAMIPLIAATWAFTAALLANPITWIIVGIILLIAAIVLLVQNWDLVKAKTAAAWDAIKAKLAAVWDAIKAKATAIWNGLKTAISSAWDAIKAAIVAKAQAVLDFVIKWGKTFLDYFLFLPKQMLKIGTDIVLGLRDGIVNAWHFVTDKVEALIAKIPLAIRKLMGIASPSKVMAQLGAQMSAGLALGIESGQSDVQASLRGLTSDLAVNARVSARAGAGVTAPAAATGPTEFYLKSGAIEIVDGEAYITGILSKQILAAPA